MTTPPPDTSTHIDANQARLRDAVGRDVAGQDAVAGNKVTATATQTVGGDITVGLEISPQDYATIHERVARLESWRQDAAPRLVAVEEHAALISQQLADARQGFQTSTYLLGSRTYELDKTLQNVRTALELNTSQLEHVGRLQDDVTALIAAQADDRQQRIARQIEADAEKRWQRWRDVAYLIVLIAIPLILVLWSRI